MRTIKITLPLRNNGKYRKTFEIEKGTLIEVRQPDMQNVVIAHSVQVTLDPNEKKDVLVDAYCVNMDLAWPTHAKGKLTPLAFNKPFANQHDVWNSFQGLNVSRDPNAEMRRELRVEMVDKFKRSSRLQNFIADLGYLYDDIPGETISEKSHFLIDVCMIDDGCRTLIPRLHEKFPNSTTFDRWHSKLLQSAA
jgi:hypothetical protein